MPALTFDIGSVRVANGGNPFIIAEAGSNFNQSLDTALKLIDVAADCGADAVKFQLFQAGELYPADSEMYNLFKAVELNPDWVGKLFIHARDRKIQFLASAFDRKSVDVLDAVGVPAHKIASSETTNMALLGYIAAKHVPMIISTGMCDLVDVTDSINICEAAGNNRIALLQCVTMYPLPPELANLRVMELFKDVFSCPVGFSDHTLGIAASIAAVARGASIIEKHFTLDKNAQGPDHFYALEPSELNLLVASAREAHVALGQPVKDLAPEERRLGRREGLYAARRISKGQKLGAGDISVRRPAVGLRARYRDTIVGSVAQEDLEKDAPITWEQIRF